LAYIDRSVSVEVTALEDEPSSPARTDSRADEPIAEAQPEEVVTAVVDELLEGFSSEETLHQRISEEIARAAGRPNRVVVLHCCLENIESIKQASGEAHAKLVVLKVGGALRSHMRSFDVLSQTGDHHFTVLLPDPGEGPEQRLSSLARTVTHEIAKHEELNEPIPLRLAFGYALHPRDGRNRKILLDRAANPRIRVV
jgi:GGDEF domain-containing protein